MTDDPIKRLFRSRKRRWTKEPLAALTNEDHGDIERAEQAFLEAVGSPPASEGDQPGARSGRRDGLSRAGGPFPPPGRQK